MIFSDTIAALATPPGSGGISIIRLSGDKSIETVNKIFTKDISKADGYTLHYGKITDKDGNVIDEVLVSVFRAPKSYTGENAAEISCHGSMTSANAILLRCIEAGARYALGGEFTKRAFLNGKIDLAQAQAVIDIINSKSERALSAGVNQLGGALSEKINSARSGLVRVMAWLSAEADFPDEGVSGFSDEGIKAEISKSLDILNALLKTADEGRLVRDGISTAILGRPNAGKSSLLNALVNKNRAIVTDIPGTTRDTVEDFIQLGGVALRLIDTAGIRKSTDTVERLGIELAKKAAEESDIIIYVADLSKMPDENDAEISRLIAQKHVILALNKTDIVKSGTAEEYKALFKDSAAVNICAQNGDGIDALKNEIISLTHLGADTAVSGAMLTSIRHIEAVTRAKQLVQGAYDAYLSGVPADFMAVDLQSAIGALGEITGVSVSEEIIDRVFKDFCVGK